MFGTPTRFGHVSAQLKQFIDTASPLWQAGKLTNKVFGGFVSTATPHGGSHTSQGGEVPPDDLALSSTELTACRAVSVAGALKQAGI